MIRVGIGGWSFEPWNETFYPKGLAATKQLEYAASKVTAIEINATFYRTQSAASFKKWAAATPDNFMFSVKAPRAAVQRKDLREAKDSIEWFFNSGVGELGTKLGPIFWQMAPYKKFDAAEMNAYFDMLPEKLGKQKLQHALEVRHASFTDAAFLKLARERNIAVVTVESEKHPLIVEPTADFAYARLELTQAHEPTGYPKAALRKWAKTARDWEKKGDVFLYFISGAKERNPAGAMAMLEILKA
ncbi:DUF72 domain-containing protein [Terricaulis sp.]|uniref:DUF72 domain-containing protein n=1 Tax=Terricaulis sp. TaxID=2768686 RepID=UPI0037833F9B